MTISTREFLSNEDSLDAEYLKYLDMSMKRNLADELWKTIETEKHYTIRLITDISRANRDGFNKTLILKVKQCAEETTTLCQLSPIEPLKLIETKSFLKRLKKAIKYLFNKL